MNNTRDAVHTGRAGGCMHTHKRGVLGKLGTVRYACAVCCALEAGAHRVFCPVRFPATPLSSSPGVGTRRIYFSRVFCASGVFRYGRMFQSCVDEYICGLHLYIRTCTKKQSWGRVATLQYTRYSSSSSNCTKSAQVQQRYLVVLRV